MNVIHLDSRKSLTGQHYKTFYGRSFKKAKQATVFVPGKHLQPSLMFAGKTRAFHALQSDGLLSYLQRLD